MIVGVPDGDRTENFSTQSNRIKPWNVFTLVCHTREDQIEESESY